jgi:Skp family chaperone for outer membrane proteins
MSDGMLRAMDDILLLSRLLKGQSLQSISEEQQRQEEEEDLRMMEASQAKVQQWMQQYPMCSHPSLSRCESELNLD